LAGGIAGTPATYDGAFTLAQLDIGAGNWNGTIRGVQVFKSSLSDIQIGQL